MFPPPFLISLTIRYKKELQAIRHVNYRTRCGCIFDFYIYNKSGRYLTIITTYLSLDLKNFNYASIFRIIDLSLNT